jgi:replicative DNA helicase
MAKNNKFNEKVTMRFSVNQLEATIIGLLNNSHNRRFASNISRLFNMFIEESYKNDFEKEIRVILVKKIAKIISENDILGKDAILTFLDVSGKYEAETKDIIDRLFEIKMDDSEMTQLDKLVSQQLKFGLIGNEATDLMDMLTNLQTDNYEDFEEFMGSLHNKMDDISKDLRVARESIEESKQDVSLGSDSFVNLLDKIIKGDRNPSVKIKSGIRAINEIFNGGYEKGRVYLALGLAKGWKSGFLLNQAINAIKYNKLQTKNTKLKPVVVYLTMENTVDETIRRIWSHCFGNDSEVSNYEPAIAARMLEEQKIFTPNRPDLPELVIWYRSTKSINTSDMNAMLDNLEKDGKECVFLVQDYIKRIRSTVNHKELRFELSIVSDEFASLSREREIPILTAMQLNRDAFREFESSTTMEGQISAVERMGASNVGESIDLIQNVDYAFILGKTQSSHMNERDEIEYTDRFLVFKLIASRGKSNKINSFKHRFKDGNDMALMEDLNLPNSISVLTYDDLAKDRISTNGQKTRGPRKIG